MEFRKLGGLLGSVAVGITLCAGSVALAQDDNGPTQSVPVASSSPKATSGSVKCTADINSDGSVLACKSCNTANTKSLGTGEYQVEFKAPCTNILAIDGWSRWVQPDALNTGSTYAYCTTADRRGDANAVWVQCQNNSGPVNTSFFLFIAK